MIKAQTEEEFQKMMDSRDFVISEAIVNAILQHINTKKKEILLFSVNIEKDDSVFDVKMDKKDFADSLKENMGAYLALEKYEKCEIIKKAIEKLEA